MLILGGGAHRLSIDIDIMCPPGTNIEDYLKDYEQSGFLKYQLIERRQAGKDVPKSHSKFFYKVAFKGQSDATSFILLDVLYEECHYRKSNMIDIASPFIKLEGEPLKVVVPSVEDILGDKLVAFAPETTGIPYYKNDKLSTLEIIKQLYDVGRLFDRMQDIDMVSQSFKAIAKVELGYRNLGNDIKQIYNVIRQTALNISTRGFIDKEKFSLLQKGIVNIKPFIYMDAYRIEDAIVDASKEDTVKIYNSVSIFLCATVSEGYGLTGLEAMSCGAVLVSTDYNGVKEYAVNEENALLSPVKNVEALVCNVKKVIEDYNLRKRLSSNGISRAKNFSWEKAISLFENYIQTSCKNREK